MDTSHLKYITISFFFLELHKLHFSLVLLKGIVLSIIIMILLMHIL